MAVKINAIRGMNDLLPQNSSVWQQVEGVLKSTAASFGFSEIRFPVVEKTGLFCRAIGEVTDVVEKEMYTFTDRDGDSLSLRPEGTAGCVRACLENSLLHGQEQRLWYIGPMFRHERPQKGRYRQFHQFGSEVFGIKGPDIDAEIIAFTATVLEKFGLEQHKESLDEDCRRRMYTNPLRVLDTKNEDIIRILADAPKLSDYFGEETRNHFAGLCSRLDSLGIKYELNSRLVRGLDYYNLTVFEWVTEALGSQGTVCGGGRYDGLVEQLGGQSTPAIGFAIGLERLILLLETLNLVQGIPAVDIMICAMGDEPEKQQLQIAMDLRRELPELRIMTHCGGGKFKKQMAHADKSGARFAVIIGEDEIASRVLSVKDLRSGEQQTVEMAAAAAYFKSVF